MPNLRRVSPCILLLALVAVSDAQVVKKKDGYLIFIKYTKGQVIKQNASMVVVGNPKLSTNSQIITKCLDVDKKGISTLEVTTPTAPNKPPNKRKVKVDRHGKPVGNVINGFSGNFVWPDTPTKIGETWNGSFNVADSIPGQGTMKAVYKLAAIKNIGGKKVAVVSCFFDVTGQFDVVGTGTINVRVSDGQMDTATFNVGMKQYSDNGQPNVMKLLMTIRNAK